MVELELLANVERMAAAGMPLGMIGTRLGYTGQEWLGVCEEHESILRAYSKGRSLGVDAALDQLSKQAARGNTGAARAILNTLQENGAVPDDDGPQRVADEPPHCNPGSSRD